MLYRSVLTTFLETRLAEGSDLRSRLLVPWLDNRRSWAEAPQPRVAIT